MSSTVQSVELGDVAAFIRGITFRPDDIVSLTHDDVVACMRTKNVQLDLDVSDVWGLPAAFVKNEAQLLKAGDILVSTANSWNLVGKCCWVPNLPWPATLGGFISALRPINGKVEPRYLYRWFSSEPVQARVRACARQTTNIANLSIDQCLAIKMPLLPFDEQRRIAAILDQADDLRRKRREALARLKHFPSAVMEELLDDGNTATVHRLDELVRGDDRINYGVVQPGPEVEQGIPLVRVESVVDQDFSRSNLKHISPQIEAQYSRSRLRGDEILVACVGTIGAVALAQPDQRGFNIARAVARIPVDPMMAERVFVAEYLRKPETQAYFKSETRTVAQPTLNIKQLCETRIPLPPLSVQRTFVARVAEIDKLKTHHRAHLVRLDGLFASLQHRAFRGEL